VVVHAVANEAPGAPVQRAALERGLERALELLDQDGVRSLAVPDLGLRIQNIDVDAAAAILVDALARRLRRGAALEQVRIVSLDPAYLRTARERLIGLGASEA
jgi:O-acetyl-ADP-ribose deacetylase (regulator of RNase III)